MFNLASSLLYNSLFQQNNNGEFEHKGNSAIKPPTYTLGLKAIPDDVVWALSAINLDQYELPEWNITVTKTGVNLSMVWKHHPEQMNNTQHSIVPTVDPTGNTSVIKKLGIPVSKLIGEPDKQAVDLQGYVQRMQPMQSILTIRPDQLRTGAENIDQEAGRVKANSIESPPKSESPQKYDTDEYGESGNQNGMDEDNAKTGQIQRTSVITENRPIKHENNDKMDCGDGCGDHDHDESDEIDPGTDNQLQIDESEDVDVTEPDSKSLKLDSESGYTDHTVKTGKIANWNLPSRKSPIQELLERHNLGHIGQSLAQAQQAQQQQQQTSAAQTAAQSGQTQYSTLQSLYANPVFHQNLRTSVLQSRGITPQTLPLLLPQQGGTLLNSQPKNLFLTTQHANGLAAATSVGMSNLDALKAQTQRPMVSPVGRSPIPTHAGLVANMNGNGTTTTKSGKDKGPFSCSLCGRTFSLRGNLLRHERIHRGDKPFRCRFCNKAFIQRTDVLAHERVHTGEKPFACQYCGKRFPRRSTMKEHEKSFCRARVALEEGRKPILAANKAESESNSGEQSPASVSPPPTATQEAAAGLLAISGQIIASHQKDTLESSAGSHDSSSSGSKTTSPEHTSSGSGSPSNSTESQMETATTTTKTEKKPLDATDFSVKAVIAN